jgi:hypothetical protein
LKHQTSPSYGTKHFDVFIRYKPKEICGGLGIVHCQRLHIKLNYEKSLVEVFSVTTKSLCGLSTLKSSCASRYSKVGGEIIVGHFFVIYKIHV